MTILRLRKSVTSNVTFTPDYGGVWRVKIAIQNYEQPDRYDADDFDFSDVNQTAPDDIGNVFIDGTKYTSVDSLLECRENLEVFYYNRVNQILYVHVSHGRRLDSSNVNVQETFGFSSSRVFYDSEDNEYLPLISGEIEIDEEVDRLVWNTMTFPEQEIEMDNRMGTFDVYFDKPTPGANVEISYISDKDVEDGKTEYTQLYVGFVQDDDFSKTTYSVTVADLRAQFTALFPVNVFSSDDYPYLDDDMDNEAIPDGYGPQTGIPATCTNSTLVGPSMTETGSLIGDVGPYDLSAVEDISSVSFYVQLDDADSDSYSLDLSGASNQSAVTVYELYAAINSEVDDITASSDGGALKIEYSGGDSPDLIYIYGTAPQVAGIGEDVEYRFAELYSSGLTVYVENDDGDWEEVTPSSSDAGTGSFVLDPYTGRDSSGSPRDSKVDVTLRTTDGNFAPEVVIDLVSEVSGVDYDSDNYDTGQVEEEIANYFTGNGSGVSFYTDEQTELYEHMETLQGADIRGWRFFAKPDGRYSIKVDDLDRAVSAEYLPIDNIDDDLYVERDLTDYATSVKVTYPGDVDDDESFSITEDSRKTAIYNIYLTYQQVEFDSLLTSEEDAEYKADYIARDYALARAAISFTINEIIVTELYDVVTFDTATVYRGIRTREFLGERKLKVSEVSYDLFYGRTTITGIDITKEIEDV
jgi:hypothetical protein